MIEITAPRKNSIVVESPVLFAAGFAGYDGSPYRKLLSLDKFGALVTPPISLKPRFPAQGLRVVELHDGFLLHTGLPNPGIRRVLDQYDSNWQRSVLPIIVHLIATHVDDMVTAARIVESSDAVAGIELGLHDQVTMRELREYVHVAQANCDLPVMVRLPLYSALEMGEIAQHSGADALVVAAPPRGTEREAYAGRLVGGRAYGRWQKALNLHMVGRIAQYASVPVIGVGGIETADDARDFIAAGATAVQLDTIVWRNPRMAEAIARNLGGSELTRTSGALSDEWTPGFSHTQKMRQMGQPPNLPEMFGDGEEHTQDAASDFDDLFD